MQRYIIIKYRSSSIMDKIHQLLSELWPLISVLKMVSGRYLLNTLVYWIHISCQVRLWIKSTDHYQSYGPLLNDNALFMRIWQMSTHVRSSIYNIQPGLCSTQAGLCCKNA